MFFDQTKNFVFSEQSVSRFNETALELFQFQYKNNKIYKQFVDLNHINLLQVKTVEQIPFLPIEFFKNHKVICGDEIPLEYFESSGTSGMQKSKHFVSSLAVYEESFLKGFSHFYGNIKAYCLLALLPNYQEQKRSSLIYMIKKLIDESGHPDSGFFLHDNQALKDKLLELKTAQQKTILFGVSYALLDMAEQYPISVPETIIFETGGMKGRRKEMIREEVHSKLQKAFGVPAIHGEYGMTELLSQAYSNGNGIFVPTPWMKILIRDINDPKAMLACNKTGGINVIDLANRYSCSFIATQDLGKLYENGSFEVLGRFDHSDVRGCNLMIE